MPYRTDGAARLALVAGAIFGLLACSDPTPTENDDTALGAVTARVISEPVPVLAEGRIQVVYELDVRNPDGNPDVRLGELTIMAGSDVVASYGGGSLRDLLSQPDLTIEEGNARGLFLWLSFAPDQVPSTLLNRLEFDGHSEVREVHVDIVERTLEPVRPPLRGEGWVAANIGNHTGHRRAALVLEDGVWIAQRFAVDWVQIDPTLRTYDGDPLLNDSYYAYGEEILATAGGVVVDVRDGIPENEPGSRAVEITEDNIGGNSVTIERPDGTAVYYAHLIPGSTRVAVGDLVEAGDVLGLVGNSGNSSEPHLHIHFANVTDYAAFSGLKADGLPFVFDDFEIIASDRSITGVRQGEMPLGDAVVTFR